MCNEWPRMSCLCFTKPSLLLLPLLPWSVLRSPLFSLLLQYLYSISLIMVSLLLLPFHLLSLEGRETERLVLPLFAPPSAHSCPSLLNLLSLDSSGVGVVVVVMMICFLLQLTATTTKTGFNDISAAWSVFRAVRSFYWKTWLQALQHFIVFVFLSSLFLDTRHSLNSLSLPCILTFIVNHHHYHG